MAQRVRVRLFATIIDDEDWPWDDEVAEFDPPAEADELDEVDQEETILSFDGCAGDEVRLKGSVTATLETNQRVRFRGTFRLYEGQSCRTDDPDGDAVTFERVVGSDRRRTVHLYLPGDGGGSAEGTIRLSNRTV
jgi:hypothetical protein